MRILGPMLMTIAACGLVISVSFVFGQGSLTPPGAPAPTMKTLQEIEPRTPITNLPYTISSAGSYYLTGNLTGIAGTNGITIVADEATLDMNGFALIGISGSDNGVEVIGARYNIAIHNGTVRNWGSQGIKAWYANNSQIINVRAFTNGLTGISIGEGSLVSGCTASDNNGSGIYASSGSTVIGCSAYKNSGGGIYLFNGESTAVDCTANLNGSAGFDIGAASTIRKCTAYGNSGYGIYTAWRSLIAGCTVSRNTGDGIFLQGQCLIMNNSCSENGYGVGDGAGIHVINDSDSRIDGNNLTRNDRGIYVQNGGNLIIRNSASGNGGGASNYVIVAGNSVGGIVDVSGGGFTNTNPWVNFEF